MAALEELAGLVKQLPVGKRVGGDWYIHRDALERHAPTLFGVVSGTSPMLLLSGTYISCHRRGAESPFCTILLPQTSPPNA